MTHPMVMALGVGIALGVAVFAFLSMQQQQRNNNNHRTFGAEFANEWRSEPPPSGSGGQSTTTARERSATPREPNTKTRDFDRTCSICLEDVTGDLMRLRCGHLFHLLCVQKLEQQLCPNCRKAF